MKTFIIIQARMNSTRLPGKVMLPLCGTTVLEMMLKRLSAFHERIIIATTDDGSEAPIVEVCNRHGVKYHRGDTDDVLGRYYEAAVKYAADDGDAIVRLTSDCPLIDGGIVRRCIETFEQSGCDYLSNTGGSRRSFPRGLDCEVLRFEALQRAFFRAKKPFEREHVTPYIHTTHKEEFTHTFIRDNEDNSKYRLTLDEGDDYLAIQEVYKHFDCRVDFDYGALLATLKKHPYIYHLNSHVTQKKPG